MTMDELRLEWRQLAHQIDIRANRRAEIRREIEKRKRVMSAQQRVDRLTDEEKDVLREILCET